MGKLVRLTVVPDEGEAEIMCGLLRTEGITCDYCWSDLDTGGSEGGGSTFAGFRAILVDESDVDRARELLPEAG
jgi:hypothetical protein